MWTYSDLRDSENPNVLPDVEIFEGWEYGIGKLGDLFYWYCLPGCLPETDAYGPFENIEELQADLYQWSL